MEPRRRQPGVSRTSDAEAIGLILDPREQELCPTFAERATVFSQRMFLNQNTAVMGVGSDHMASHALELPLQGAKEPLLFALRTALVLI